MAREFEVTTTRTIDLGYDQLLILEGRPGTRIKVLFGGVWLTEHGSEADHFPRAGDEITLVKRGRAVVQPFGPTWIRITESAPVPVWRRFLGAAAAMIQRFNDVIAQQPATKSVYR